MDLVEIEIKQAIVKNMPDGCRTVELTAELSIIDLAGKIISVDAVLEKNRFITTTKNENERICRKIYEEAKNALSIYSKGLLGKNKLTINIKE
jgi:hypothetical protein